MHQIIVSKQNSKGINVSLRCPYLSIWFINSTQLVCEGLFNGSIFGLCKDKQGDNQIHKLESWTGYLFF